jgi:hypothetical protein
MMNRAIRAIGLFTQCYVATKQWRPELTPGCGIPQRASGGVHGLGQRASANQLEPSIFRMRLAGRQRPATDEEACHALSSRTASTPETYVSAMFAYTSVEPIVEFHSRHTSVAWLTDSRPPARYSRVICAESWWRKAARPKLNQLACS